MAAARGDVTLFVSDVHLSQARPEMHAAFVRLLRAQAREARALYILGDLFDYWIGDDDLSDPWHAGVAAELAEVSAAGCATHFMAGNRDFLLAERFAAAARLSLIADPTRLALAGEPTLLLHGDTLCVDDVDYQAFRAQVRDPAWQRNFLAQPLAQRRRHALALREQSESSQREKSAEIMDAAPRAIEEAFRRSGCTRMIHGHTHRPGRHEVHLDGRLRERWVLGAWFESAIYLRCDDDGWRLQSGA